jgi:DNA repair ATPase RecN
VLKRIVEQEARLAEQAALIKRLEAKLNCALETSGHIRAEVSHMPQKICEQLTEQEERCHTLMHSLVQKLGQTLTQQLGPCAAAAAAPSQLLPPPLRLRTVALFGNTAPLS